MEQLRAQKAALEKKMSEEHEQGKLQAQAGSLNAVSLPDLTLPDWSLPDWALLEWDLTTSCIDGILVKLCARAHLTPSRTHAS